MESRFSVYFRVALLCILLSSIVSYGEERRTEAILEYLVAEARKAYNACENYEQLQDVRYKLKAIKSLCEAAKTNIFEVKYELDILENNVSRSNIVGPEGLVPHKYSSSELSVMGQELD